MPIPFRDLRTGETTAVIAYLRFIDEPDGAGVKGALFVTSERGDPMEFCFTKIDTPSSPLWQTDLIRSHAVSSIAKALFEAANYLPDVVLALAAEAPPEVFSEELAVQVPMCRVAQEAGPAAPEEEVQRLSDSLCLHWVSGYPVEDVRLADLVETLKSRQLLLEPFERAALGIQEAFSC